MLFILQSGAGNLNEKFRTWENLINKTHALSRHAGECQNPVKTIAYWMLVFTSMTEKQIIQRFPRYSI